MAWTTRFFGQASRVLMAAAESSATITAADSYSIITAAAPKRGRPAGILKSTPVSPALGEFLGVSEISRTNAVKKVWEYIKSNKLQNPANKKEIICDDKLKTIFSGKDKVGFLEIAKLMTQHFIKSK
ncbi:protein TRI1-like [Rutidosis leptorrhynchoides]|uniref:protein TRI1-like n=1 Tax=Rutidosis leptorrhynchoides TaxID=125765 RepID=UPI003A9A418A